MADDVLSLRLNPDRRAVIDMIAARHGITVSDLLRAAADHVARMPVDDVTKLLACTACGGTGQRFKTKESNG
jgi:uncharacterized protein (DUF1778 family)